MRKRWRVGIRESQERAKSMPDVNGSKYAGHFEQQNGHLTNIDQVNSFRNCKCKFSEKSLYPTYKFVPRTICHKIRQNRRHARAAYVCVESEREGLTDCDWGEERAART